MTNLPKANVTAGLNVPADSQVVPWGERMGSFEARVHAPKGRSVARAAKQREAARLSMSGAFRRVRCGKLRMREVYVRRAGSRQPTLRLRLGQAVEIRRKKERINAEETEKARRSRRGLGLAREEKARDGVEASGERPAT